VIGLLAVGVVDAAQAFVGFSNPAPITVAALYVLARAVEATGAVDRLTAGLFPERPAGGRGQHRLELARMLALPGRGPVGARSDGRTGRARAAAAPGSARRSATAQ
jgi:hypothetical protein